MATIKDVAVLAGVSIATVSNYINGKKPVSKETESKIRQAIDELQYEQNLAARNLRAKQYREVGVILPNLNDPYYIQVLQGIEKTLAESGYFVNITFSYDSPGEELKSCQALLRKQICGLILVSCRPDSWQYYYDNFTAKGRPLVMIDRQIKGLDANFVCLDNNEMIYQITDTLLGDGYRQICLFTGSEAFTCEQDCIRGFRAAFERHGLQPKAEQLVQCDLSKEEAFRSTIQLMNEHRPECILASSGLVATGIMEGLRLLGYSDEDVPVITLGEEHWNLFTQSHAAMSTSRPAIKVGDTAASLLLKQLSSSLDDTERVVLRDALSAAPVFPVMPEEREQEPLRLLLLDNPTVRTFQGLIRNFELEYGVKIEAELLPHHKMLQALQEQSDRYDVLMFDIPWLAGLCEQNVLADITAPVNDLDTGRFFPDCLTHFGAFHGRYYAIPFMYAPQMLYYRKDLFEDVHLQRDFAKQYDTTLRPPLTLKEYNAVAEFFTMQTDAVPYGISVAAAYDECFAPEIHLRLQAFGSRICDNSGNVDLENLQTLKAYINLKRSLAFAKPNYLQTTDISAAEEFCRGETAMLITYPAFLEGEANLRKSSNIGCSLIPGRAPILGGWSLGISHGSDKKEDAFHFLQWCCSEQISNYFTIMGGQTAITATYTNDELVRLNPWLPLYYRAYSYAQPQPVPVVNGRTVPMERLDSVLCRWAYEMIRSDMEVQQVIQYTQRDLKELLGNHR